MDTPVHLLVIENRPDPLGHEHCARVARAVGDLLGPNEFAIQTASLDRCRFVSEHPDLIVIHAGMGPSLSRAVIQLKRQWDGTPILAVFCGGNEAPWGVLDALAAGLDDYLVCPLRPIDFVPRVEVLLRQRRANLVRADESGGTSFSFKNLVGEAEPFLRLIEVVPRVARLSATVLITGETGTGKELFARAIHYTGPRRGKPFAPVTCGALPDHLVENELFGHAKGAYTDASSAQNGIVAEAEGGTLFLDEVESLSLLAQSKLLRFLQEREYRPLGSARSRVADVRVVAATNVDLRAEVGAQRFREDLFYRLSVLLLHVPPLRERLEDIPRLANHFLRRCARREGCRIPRLSDAALEALTAHPWKGNVRELEAVIQRSMLLAGREVLRPEDLNLPGHVRESGSASAGFQEAKHRVIDRFERDYVKRVLAAHRGNISQAARSAGTDRRALQRLMRKHRIDRQGFCA